MPEKVIPHPAATPIPPDPEHATFRAILREELQREMVSKMRGHTAEPVEDPPESSPLMRQFLVTVGAGMAVWALTRVLERRATR